ncbi:MAG: T9SS type A sorting domain-containing protein [Bacteroidetes bacterium]|nr:T9SS type A sorting domain-containing protein [Bacteroidota bacterium]MBK9799360.1 T9SS type A sorting domain-containing protein [Bacteroidota bacterium]MBP6413371.1 T9SS type A sorting domain-containing protein [Bacteroidia bacterium]
MKKIIIVIFCVVIYTNYSSAQISFENWYPTINEYGIRCVSDNNGGYLIGLEGGYNNGSPSTECIVRINSIGDTIWVARVNFPDRAIFGKIALSPEGDYVGVGTVYNANGELDTWVMRVDSSSGNVLSQFIVPTSIYSGGAINITGIQFLANKHLMISSAYPGNIVIICDSLGSIIKSSNFGTSYPYSGNLFKYDSNFLLLTYQSFPIPIYNQCRALIINDSLDTISSVKLQLDSVHSNFGNSFLLPDKKILSQGAYGNTMQFGLGVSLNDSLGNLLIEKRTSINIPPSSNVYVPRITSTVSGGFYFGGYVTLPGNQYPLAFATKYNAQFDSVWTKYYGDSVDTRIEHFFTLPDETFFAAGRQIRNNGTQLGVYYLKTDTLGNVSTAISQHKKEENYLHIYPNPSSSYTGIHYIGNATNFLVISNEQGQIIYKKQVAGQDSREVINTSQFITGTYLCSIVSNYGRIEVTKKLIVAR